MARFRTYNLAQALPLAREAQGFALDKVSHWRSKAVLGTKVFKFHFLLELQTKVVVLRFNHTQKICYQKSLTRAAKLWYNFGAAKSNTFVFNFI